MKAMKKSTFNPSSKLTELRDVINFFEYMTRDLKSVWHPDDDFTTYINLDNKEQSWSKTEGELLNKRMAEAFEVCNDNDTDIYQLGMETVLLLERGTKYKAQNKSPKKKKAWKLSN